MAGVDKLGDFLVSLGFSVEGVDKLKLAVHELENMREVFESIRAPFQAFNETLEAMKTIGEAVVKPFESLYEISAESANAADHLTDLSKKLGISRDELEEWGFVAQLTGSNAGEMQNALRLLNKDIAGAINGNKEAVESYRKLGVELKNQDGSYKQAGDVLHDILGELSKIPDEAQRAAKGMEFFGRGGVNIRELFGVGPDKLEELRHEFELLGGRAPEGLFKLGEAFNDMKDKLALFREGLKNWFALGFQPVINGVLKWFEDVAKKYGPSLRLFLFNVGETLAEIGFVVGGAVDTFAGAFKVIGDNIDLILPIVALWKYEMVSAAVATIAAWALAAAPFIALFLVVEDFLGFLQGKDSVIGLLVESWQGWIDSIADSHPVIAGIMDTIGDLGEGLKMAGLLVKDLAEAFAVGGFGAVWDELTTATKEAFDFYRSDSGSLLEYLGYLVTGFVDLALTGFGEVGSIIKETIGYVVDLIKAFQGGGIDGVIAKLTEDLGSVLGGFREMFSAFFSYIGDAVSSVASRIINGLISPVQSAISSLFGGGTAVSPSASTVSNSSTSVNNSQATASISQTVNASPGMDTRELANQSASMMKDFLSSELRAAYPAAAPGR